MSASGINNNKMLKSIIETKKECEKLEHLINYLKMENFEYALKCNRIENALSKMNLLLKSCPGKLTAASNNICDLLQAQRCTEMREKTRDFRSSISGMKTPETRKTSSCTKAHVVKPHNVNGHILYIPTINLTRVSDINLSNALNESEGTSTLETRCNSDMPSHISMQPSSSRAETSTSSDTLVEDESQISQEEDIEEASTSSPRSPSHSTVLSGTFQEVKIYLNQISPDILNEESRKLIKNSQCSPRRTRSPAGKYRKGISLGRVNKKKRKLTAVR